MHCPTCGNSFLKETRRIGSAWWVKGCWRCNSLFEYKCCSLTGRGGNLSYSPGSYLEEFERAISERRPDTLEWEEYVFTDDYYSERLKHQFRAWDRIKVNQWWLVFVAPDGSHQLFLSHWPLFDSPVTTEQFLRLRQLFCTPEMEEWSRF